MYFVQRIDDKLIKIQILLENFLLWKYFTIPLETNTSWMTDDIQIYRFVFKIFCPTTFTTNNIIESRLKIENSHTVE